VPSGKKNIKKRKKSLSIAKEGALGKENISKKENIYIVLPFQTL